MICNVDGKGYCVRHQTVHPQNVLRWALDPSPKGERYRLEMDRRLRDHGDAHANSKADAVIPSQPMPPPAPSAPMELGDMVEKALDSVGITKARVAKLLGDCGGCQARQAALNAVSIWAKRIAGGAKERAKEFLANVLNTTVAQLEEPDEMVRWTSAVTTVPSRRNTLLPQTLASLKAAGFQKPRLFVDGSKDIDGYEKQFGLDVTVRWPQIQVAHNWVLTAWELWMRNPSAEMFAIFQDDLLASKNLMAYLSQCEYQEGYDQNRQSVTGVYWNLYTIPMNEEIVPTDEKGERIKGWHPARPETGKGAVGLVFSRQAIIALLGSRHLAARPGDINRGWRLIDGGIVEAMQQAGWREYIHYPSLVQHTGMESAKTRTNHLTLVNHPHSYAASKCWMGEDFDCMTMALDKPRRVSLE